MAVPILDQIAGVSLFDAGEFWCSDLFYLGAHLSALATACSTLKQKTNTVRSKVEAFFEWAKLDIMAAVREIAYRYMAAQDLSVAPPTILMRSPEEAGDMLPEIESFARWMDTEFLGDKNKVHRRFFKLGLETFQLLDEELQGEDNKAALQQTCRQAVEESREFLTSLAEGIDAGKFATAVCSEIRTKIEGAFGKRDDVVPLAEMVRALNFGVLLR